MRSCSPQGGYFERTGDIMTEDDEIKGFVKEHYSEIAQKHTPSCCGPQAEQTASCCGPQTDQAPRRADGLYSEEELRSLPESVVNSALGCGNPMAIAELEPGDVVLDLGSGGGIDCFLAAERVGETGKVIGVDMTPEMIRLARENTAKVGLENVEFRLGEMEHLPVESDSVDVVISNCVINLSPDKDSVFREAYRVLKSGGRLCVSDMATVGELPPEVRENPVMWSGCVAGALDRNVYLDKLRAAGFSEISSEDVEVSRDQTDGKLISLKVKAIKP